MILNNLSRALKTQNWLAAGVEFVIVIAGVVIGFQIQAWNEGRQQRAEEARIITRIHADFQRIEVDANRSLDLHQTIAADFSVLVSSLRAGELSENDEPAVRRALFIGPVYQTSGDRSATFTELLYSGRANIISDEDLLNELVAYEDLLGRFEQAQDYFVAQASVFQRPFSARFQYDVDAPFFTPALDVDIGTPPIEAFDFDAMVEDEAFINAAERMLFNHSIYTMWRQRVSARIDVIQSKLEAETR